MSVAVIRFELWRMAAQAEEHVREASELLEHGTETQKIKAASQIAFFRTEKADFESRLRQLEDCPENLIANLIEGFRKEWLIQREMFAEWSRGLRA